RIMTEERERNPEWASTIELLRDSSDKQARKDAEVAMADHIVVPSDFVRTTLQEHPTVTATVDVIPYGAPEARYSPPGASPHAGSALRLLYVGNLTQSKGLSYLFAAMVALRGVATLTLVGAKPVVDCRALTNALKQHTWLGPVPHDR